MRLFLPVMLCLVCVGPAKEKEPQRIIDIYIYETRHLDHRVTFYSWIDDNGSPVGRGGAFDVECTVPEICVGWSRAGALYIETKGGDKGDWPPPSMFLVTIAKPDDGWVDGGSSKAVKIWFGQLDGGGWDGKIYIECPHKSIFKIRRTVNIKKAE
jgi:hypothetical protein